MTDGPFDLADDPRFERHQRVLATLAHVGIEYGQARASVAAHYSELAPDPSDLIRIL